MVITEPGRITEHITFLGRVESCIYLVDGGEESVIIGGGMAYMVPDVVEQIEKFSIDVKKIKRMVILHAHFDHCGAVPYFKKIWPWMKVTASVRAKEILATPKISQSIAQFNHAAFARFGVEKQARELGVEYTDIDVEETVGEGDIIGCGDLTLKVLEVPGHSTCSIAVYMEEEKALFGSDAAGIQYKGSFMAAGNSNFDLYEQSLQKMAAYDVEIELAEHNGVSTGENARTFLSNSIEAAKAMRSFMEESYRRTRDVAESTEELTDYLVSSQKDYFLPREVNAIVAGQMMRYIAKTIENGSES